MDQTIKPPDADLKQTGDVMPSTFKTGITDMYQVVAWLKFRRYHVPKGTTITITGLGAGLVDVAVQEPNEVSSA